MNHLVKSRELPYPMELLYNVVLDVEAYPQFIDEIETLHIISKIDHNMIADVKVALGPLKATYRSKIHFMMKQDSAIVEIEASNGPFKHLSGRWSFSPQPNSTLVEFEIKFDLEARILQTMASLYLDKATQRIMDKFEKKAEGLYEQTQK